MTQKNIGGTVYEGEEINGYFIPKKVVTAATPNMPQNPYFAGPAWWQAGPTVRKPGTTLQDFTAQYVTNQAIKAMYDPYTQLQTAEALTRMNPDYQTAYFGYQSPGGNVVNPKSPTEQQQLAMRQPVSTQSMLDAMYGNVRGGGVGRIAQITEQLDMDRLKQYMPEQLLMDARGGISQLQGHLNEEQKLSDSFQNKAAWADAQEGMKWFNDYLDAVKQGAQQGQTRSAQRQTKSRLATLNAMADDPTAMNTFKPYKTLAENITNPYVKDRPFEALTGASRNAGGNWSDAYQRGGLVYRNRKLT